MDFRPRRAAALVAALGIALSLPAAQPNQDRAEADLKALINRIQREEQQVRQVELQKSRATRSLRDAEQSISKAEGELTRLRAQRAERQAIRRHLEAERAEREAERERTEADLARQLRAAYLMGQNEPLKLLLNQQSPTEFSRNLAYYGYLGRRRADQIGLIGEKIAKIEELDAKIAAEDAQLAELESARKARLGELDQQRKLRGEALVSLEKESGNRTASLRSLRQERTRLEQLVERLSRLPYDPGAPFAQAQKRLNWPVAGKVIVTYGASIEGQVRSEGIDIDTERGEPVKAVHEGQVVHSDWLPNRGNLIILNHGNGYLSIYAHLGELHVENGRKVAAGETIALAGDTGGRRRPGLYFEIRRNNKPVDPRAWFRTAAPPAR
jgi:septal ring factor EnvC (AmiA/AmiB activator)